MTEITPALLAEFKHRVPEGAMIPARTPYAYPELSAIAVHLDGVNSEIRVRRGGTYWTREPIRPPLPTGLGAVLKDVTTTGGVRWDYAVRSDTSRCPWVAFDRANRGGGVYLADDDLATWTVASEGVEL